MRILSQLYKITDHPDENLNTDIPKYIGRYQQLFFSHGNIYKQSSETIFRDTLSGNKIWCHVMGKQPAVMFLKGPWSNLFYTKKYDMA